MNKVKRFYERVELAKDKQGFTILLDDRPVKSPGRELVQCPNDGFAQKLAGEWRQQGEFIEPGAMPFMHFASVVTDHILSRPEDARAEIVKYAHSDLLCYRASEPDTLIARQASLWNPVLERFKQEDGITFNIATGIQFVEQGVLDMDRFKDLVRPLHGYELGAVQVVTTLSGSAVLALALAKGWLAPDTVWKFAHVDEDFQSEHWGCDADEQKRRQQRYNDFRAASSVFGSTPLDL